MTQQRQSSALEFTMTFAVGLLFAVGLGVAGMTNANLVVAFLQIDSGWDPTLAFVMVGGIGVHFAFYSLIRRRNAPVFRAQFSDPSKKAIDRRLLAGAVLFGCGWGLAGVCPGPAIASLASLSSDVLLFAGSMFAGMGLFSLVNR